MINHIREDFPNIRFNRARKVILKKIIQLLFDAQQQKPFLHIEESELPLCWNNPSDWNKNYIKYEWGHLPSQNQRPDQSSSIENIGLYSARCNRHIQSSLNVQELMVYGGVLSQRISIVLRNRKILFSSEKWKKLILELRK